MSGRDSFSVYLRDLPADEISFRVVDDGRHVLDIARDVSLYVRPGEDDLDAVIAGLRKLADTAGEMAGALSGGEDHGGGGEDTRHTVREAARRGARKAAALAAAEAEDTRRLAAIRDVLGHFDWEYHDRQLALEAIERIAEGGQV